MPKLGVQVVLEAEDKARGVLDQFGRTVVDLTEKSERSFGRMETSIARTTRSVRALAIPLASELSPALGQTTSQIAHVVTSAALLGSGLTAVGIAAVGVASVIGGQLVSAWQKSRQEAEAFDAAIRSADLGRIGEAAKKAARDIEALTESQRRLNELMGRAPGALTARFGPGLAQAQMERELTGTGLSRADADRLLAESEVTRTRTALSQRGLTDFLLGPVGQRVAEMERQARDLERGVGGPADVAAAARIRAAIPAVRRFGMPFPALPPVQGAEERFSFGLSAQDQADLEAQREELAGIRGRRMMQPLPIMGAEERFGFELTGEDRRRLDEDTQQRRERILQVDRDRAAILREQAGLTEQERATLDLIAIERDKILKLANDQLTPAQRLNVELEAQVKSAAILRSELERTDAAAGFAKGFKDVEEDWAASGRRMEGVARGTANNIQEAFSRALRGDVVGKDFVNAMTRTITDEIARYLTGGLAGFIRGILPGGAGPGPFGVTSALDVTGATPQALAGLTQQGYQLAGGADGRTYAVGLPGMGAAPFAGGGIPRTWTTALFGPLIGQAFQTNLQAGLQSGAVVVQNGQIISSGSELALTGVSSTGAYGESAGAGVLAGVGSAIGVLGAVYGAYGAGRSGAGTTSAVTQGAISGLLTGGPIGLVLGALAGWAGAEEHEGMTARYHRRRQRGRDAGRIVQGIADALNAPERTGLAVGDLDAALATRLLSGNTVGGLLLALARVGSHRDLIAFLEARGIMVEGFNWQGLNNIVELAGNINAFPQFLEDMNRRLRGLEASAEAILGAARVVYEEEFPGRVTVQTSIPVAALEERISGIRTQRIAVSSDFYRQGLDLDDNQVLALIGRIRNLTSDRDLADLSRTDFLRLGVSR